MTDRQNVPLRLPQGRSINRRQALAGLGGLGLSALLVACGKDSKPDVGAAGTTSTSPPVATDSAATGAAGTTATNAAGAPASGDVAALLAGAGSCAVVPELTEGPYYIDIDKVRSDIREDRQGTPLTLAIRVRDFPGCTPRANAVVDIWHCDASGVYSGFESSSTGGGGGGGGGFGGPPPGGGGPAGGGGGGGGSSSPTDTKRYLRGSQIIGADGIAQFVTIYPGWYRGRTVHVHVKVHIGNNQVVTSQLFFDEAVTRTVYAAGPYAAHTGQDTSNANDGIFARANLLTPTKTGGGYAAAINLDVKSG
jgi:protocatechuate 3,4-dioxygenase beta subunit